MLRFGCIGIGGYATTFFPIWDRLEKEGKAKLTDVVVRSPAKYEEKLKELNDKGVKDYRTLEEMLAAGKDNLDLIVIPTAIHDHMPMTIASLSAGYDVFLEKPAAAAVQDVRAMIQTKNAAGKKVAVGFQSQYGKLIRGVKNWILDGKVGSLQKVKACGLWERSETYYERNGWAGFIKPDGRWGLDGPIMNALAHQFMNLIWLSGPELNVPAEVLTVEGECYHANPIEADDLSILRGELTNTSSGSPVQMSFIATYCWDGKPGVTLEIIGDKGTIHADPFNKAELFVGGSGEATEVLESNPDQPREAMWDNVVDVLSGKSDDFQCTLETAYQHTLAANCTYLSSGGFHAIDKSAVLERKNEKDQTFRTVRDIQDWLPKAFEEGKLFNELELPWTVKPKKIIASEINEFSL